MWIMGGNRNVIINSERAERFAVSKKEDAVLIVAYYEQSGCGATLARYQTENEAYNELCDLYDAITANVSSYCMKASTGAYKPEMKMENHNGRKHKGHGGS